VYVVEKSRVFRVSKSLQFLLVHDASSSQVSV
jgi:hypothetical protein